MRSPPRRQVPGGAQLFRRMFTRLGCPGRSPHFVVEFYPYASLAHTIRLKEETAEVRLSDLLEGARLPVLEAAAALLLARLYRREPPRHLVEIYRRFSLARRTRRRIARVRQRRGRRVLFRPGGFHHRLEPLFDRLNQRYFQGKLARPRLGWSARAWRRQLGCFDPAVNQIVLNTRLDRSEVPQLAVEYVLFHEMLHVKHPLKAARCGVQAHSAAFRREEKRFPGYERARQFLEQLEASA